MKKLFGQIKTTVVLCGSPGSGKSPIADFFLTELQKKMANPSARPPVMFRIKQMKLYKEEFKLNIWDVSVGKNFQKVLHHYRGMADVILYTFDVTNKESFEFARELMGQDDDLTLPKILVGAKSELRNKRSVAMHEAKELAEKYGINYIEVSGKTGENVQVLYEGAVTLAYQAMLEDAEEESKFSVNWKYSEEVEDNPSSETLSFEEDDSAEDADRVYWRKKDPFDRLMTYARFLNHLDPKFYSKNDNGAGRKKGEYLTNYFTQNCELGSKAAIRALLNNNSSNILNNRNTSGVKWYQVRSFFLGNRNKFQGNRLCESRTEELLVNCYKSFKN